MTPLNDSCLSRLKGTFRHKFPEAVEGRPNIEVIYPETAHNQLPNSQDYYDVERVDVSDSGHVFLLKLKNRSLNLTKTLQGDFRFRVSANIGQLDSPLTVGFETPLTLEPFSPPDEKLA